MNFLQWQHTDKNQFSVFIRDITKNLTNVKHMVEDTMIESPTVKHRSNNKKVVKKKKDIIIEQQNKIRLDKKVNDDLSQLDYILDNLNNEDPYTVFKLMKTDKGILELKCRMLEHFWKMKKTYFPHVINLYFQLVDKDVSEQYKGVISSIQSKLDDTEYKLYMMKHLSHLLPPLNMHEPRIKKLDDWQIQVINHIKRGESVVVKAPTSSGKSFTALAAGILHDKILYVCPAKPIAYQVGAHFNLMGYKVHYLLDNLCHHGYDNKTTIFIGVPSTIEDNLYKLGVSFDYAVFDEIHNLNKEDDGHIYENIIKLIQCPFLALSATIGNIEYLLELFTKIHKDPLTNRRMEQTKKTLLKSGESYTLETPIHYVEYSKRFINQQKIVYENNQLHKIHPLSCIQIDDLNDTFLQSNLQFTPYDSAVLWETIEDVFDINGPYTDTFDDMLEDCSPDNFFNNDNKILTLDDTRDYEIFIKQKLVDLSRTHTYEVTCILSKFHRQPSSLKPVDTTKDIIELFKQCKGNDCLPMLAFNTDTIQCKQLFTELFHEIDTTELEYYPYHYDILEMKDDLYTKYKDKRSQFIASIKVGKTNDPKTEKQTKIDRFDTKEEQYYIGHVLNYYESCIHNCSRNDTISDTLRSKQIKNLTKEMKYYQRYPSFCNIDIFQKHKDYCFSNVDPMTGDQIRSIRREIKKTLGIKISYEHELFQMLKRGIGIYTEDMPDEYKWVLQKLLHDKNIGIVVSDRTLCLGIDLPIRSSCLLGLPGSTHFTFDDYLQMSGRAGRRGKDDLGNTIFYNLDYHGLMKGVLPTIEGSDKQIPSNYECLELFIDSHSVSNVHKYPINHNKMNDTRYYNQSFMPKLQWALRYEDNVYEFIERINIWNKEVFQSVEPIDKEVVILHNVLMMLPYDTDIMIKVYKKKVLDIGFSNWKHVCQTLQIIYNSLKDKRYTHLKTHIVSVHTNLKDMILRYQGL
jgi:superfamily II DNA or RNA helicase